MNWKIVAIEDLKNYESLLSGYNNLKDKIDSLKKSLSSVSSSAVSAVPLHGGGNKYEDNMIDKLVELERLELNLTVTKKQVIMVNRGLSVLNEEEKIILREFYMHRTPGYMENIYRECKLYSNSDIYRHKDNALRKFTIAMYGIVEL